MSALPDWALVFVLPNLRLGGHDHWPDELTLGLDGIAIVSASEARVQEVTAWSEAAKTFLESFHNGNGSAARESVVVKATATMNAVARTSWVRVVFTVLFR